MVELDSLVRGNDKSIDYCIVGLGNPGLKYFNTRHNVGFQVIDKLAEFFKIENFVSRENFQAAQVEFNESNLILIKPLTFMNASGRAVKLLSDRFDIEPGKFLIIYDDVNLSYGTLRMRPGGSDGGQNGMASIIYEMQTDDIPRLRVGIKNDEELDKLKNDDGIDLAEFVLSPFTEDELNNLNKIIEEAKNAVLFYINEGVTPAMNKFNRNVISE